MFPVECGVAYSVKEQSLCDTILAESCWCWHQLAFDRAVQRNRGPTCRIQISLIGVTAETNDLSTVLFEANLDGGL